ncbi:hypothetical protein S101359_00311 [Bacillus atrophaeus]|nr:hypothetical protein S101359_00311 [Bacillus atrophaeus]
MSPFFDLFWQHHLSFRKVFHLEINIPFQKKKP